MPPQSPLQSDEADKPPLSLKAEAEPTSMSLPNEPGLPAVRHYPSWLCLCTAIITIVSGVYSAMAFKWQNKQSIAPCKGCDPVLFEGALLQTQLMFVGEALGLIVWFIDDRISRRKNKALMLDFVTDERELRRPRCPWYFWPMCSAFDFASTLMINFSMIVTYASTVQMLRNFMVVMSAFVQMILVRKALLVHEWIGIIVITGAMVLTAIPAFSIPDDTNSSQSKIILGIVLALVGTSVQAIQLLLEEMNFRRGFTPALLAVGLEGIGGLIYSFVAWAPYQASGAEDVTASWYQQTHSGLLIGLSLLYLVGAIIFNAAGLATTKLGGGVLRGVCFACRSPLVWLVSLALKWQSYDNWNLGSMLIFIIGFMSYANLCPVLHSKSWFTKPIHMCCTNPDLDGVAPDHDFERDNPALPDPRAEP